MSQPNSYVVAALLEPTPPNGATDKAKALYATLQQCIADYRAAVTSSQSFEGSSMSMAAETAASQVAEYHAAYRQALQETTIPPGQDPTLLRRPRGVTYDHSLVPLSV